jgi:excisionase family DNA binding protein
MLIYLKIIYISNLLKYSIVYKKLIIHNNYIKRLERSYSMLEEYPDVLTIKETIEILGISRNLIYDLIHNGTLPAFRLGERVWRINKKDLIIFLSTQ